MIRYIPILFLLFSCSTVKKLITHTHAITDSVSSRSADSISVKKAVSKSTAVDISNLDLTISYPPVVSDDAPDVQVYDTSTTFGKIEHFVNHTHPSQIVIHIGNLKDSTRTVITKDVLSTHSKDTTTVKKNITTSTRDVSKKSTPLWVYAVGAGVALCVIAFIILRFNLISLIKKVIP